MSRNISESLILPPSPDAEQAPSASYVRSRVGQIVAACDPDEDIALVEEIEIALRGENRAARPLRLKDLGPAELLELKAKMVSHAGSRFSLEQADPMAR